MSDVKCVKHTSLNLVIDNILKYLYILPGLNQALKSNSAREECQCLCTHKGDCYVSVFVCSVLQDG